MKELIKEAKNSLDLWKIANDNGYSAISYTQISLFHQCPYKWKRVYIDKDKDDKGSIHLIFGSAMHTVLQEYLTKMFTVSIKEADNLDFSKRLFDALVEEFQKAMDRFGDHFTTKKELAEFYKDGLKVLDWLRKKRKSFFSNRDHELLGIELPLLVKTDANDKICLMSFLDIVIKDKRTGQIIIYDIKTSTRGWNDFKKKDIATISQLLLYKKYYAKMFDVPVDQIKVLYLILKRKVWEDSPYPVRRVQLYEPAQGKINMNRAENLLTEFINHAFDDNANKKTNINYDTKKQKLCDYCHLKRSCPAWN